MNNLLTMKDTFLEDSEVLILGVGDDDELKKYLAAGYNFGDKNIKDSVKDLEKAQQAEKAFQDAVGDQKEEKALFKTLFEDARASVNKHSECLQIAWEGWHESDIKHFFIHQSPFMSLSDWFKWSIEMYIRVLSDDEVMENMSGIGRKQLELEQGLNNVLNARKAWKKLKPKENKALALFEKRNEAFEGLTDIYKKLQAFCYYIFEDNPELLAKPSVSNLSPIVFAKMVKDSSITRKAGMVKDSSITRKIFAAINNIFTKVIKKIFDPGTTWE
jgi:hypothetical protein